MKAADVLEVLSALDHLDVWLGDGGWGVDALLGEQTRPHEDLDLITTVAHAPGLVRALAAFSLVEGHTGTCFVLKEDSDRRNVNALHRRFGVRLLPEQVVQTM